MLGVRALALIAVAVAVVVAVAVSVSAIASPPRLDASAVASPPRHRLHLPIPPLPRSLTVDEDEWSIIPSHTVVASGTVTFAVYDRGMDAHNLTIKGPGTSLTGSGRLKGSIDLQSGASGTLVAHLKPGTYLLYCNLFLGTPESHFMKGMHTLLTVR